MKKFVAAIAVSGLIMFALATFLKSTSCRMESTKPRVGGDGGEMEAAIEALEKRFKFFGDKRNGKSDKQLRKSNGSD